MREIKFRGWNTGAWNWNNIQEWVYGGFTMYYGFAYERGKSPDAVIFYIDEGQQKRCPVVPESVGQFIGLKDKNGKEIYEGDIIHSEIHKPAHYQIEFIEGGFCATHPDLEGYPIDINHFYPSIGCQIEVIGNIYENPSLLSENLPNPKTTKS